MNARTNRIAPRLGVACLILATACSEPQPPPGSATQTATSAPVTAAVAAAGPASPKATASDASPAATIDGKPITLGEVRKAARAQLLEFERQQHAALEGNLEQLIATELLGREAAKNGIDAEELQRRVVAELPPVTDADVDGFYTKFKDRINQPKEAVAGQIREKLTQDARAEAVQGLITKLRAAANVQVLLDPLRTAVSTDDDPAKGGPAGATVTIVEFSDFECGYCARAVELIKSVTDKYGDKVQIVFRDYPLPFHAKAKKAAEAAQCAHEQGEFWRYHDTLFGNQTELEVEQLKAHAAKLGLDTARFATCLDSGKFAAEIEKDMNDGVAAGVNGTPAFFVNGRFIDGAVPFEQLAVVIDDELRRSGNRVQ